MKRGNVSHVALSSNVADLSNRVAAAESRVGQPSVVPKLKGGAEEPPVPVCDKIGALEKSVNELFEKETEILEFEKKMGCLEAWVESEHSESSNLVLNNIVKRNYIIQRSDRLREVGKSLGEIQELEEHITPPVYQELPKHSEQLHKIEVNSAMTVGTAIKLHEHVSKMAEDYHKTVMSVNSQLLVWNRMFDKKP
mmetsp:Transcript_62206/g.131466  ORF Transcript_62206/g.131466 Transcript_62206/m.131466 type:complete len:195 (+) Transcript_62206:95-679(+)